MEKITVKELAQLKGCKEQYIRKLIGDGVIQAEPVFGVVGAGGKQYLIPVISLSSYDPKLVKKYNRLHGIKNEQQRPRRTRPELLKDIENLSDSERAEVAFWKRVLVDWTEYRNGRDREQADAEYIKYLQNTYPEKSFSIR